MNVFGELEDIESERTAIAKPFITTEQIAFLASRKHFR
jgi:hypothetical protein